MREIDRTTRLSRRSLLRTAAAAPAVATVSLTAAPAWAEGGALQPKTMQTLVLVARDIFPHDMLADNYYITAVKPWNTKAARDPKVKSLIEDGIGRLNADANERHKLNYLDLGWEEDRVALLRGIEGTDFFKKVRSDLVVSLYNQHELWPKFGYEGASADKGGYINRGFNDIDWLPSV